MSARVLAAVLLGPHEDDHYWPAVQRAALEWADDILVVEDPDGQAWGNETPYRKQLWERAVNASDPDDWIFILDADFILTFDPHELTDISTQAIGWRFNLYDLWDEDHYRDDNFWLAHNFPRHWMFKVGASPELPIWSGKGIHCGHYPTNFFTQYSGISIAPSRMSILHLGWMTPELRYEKYERYTQVWEQLSDFQRKHVESVLDTDPYLVELPKELQKCLKNL